MGGDENASAQREQHQLQDLTRVQRGAPPSDLVGRVAGNNGDRASHEFERHETVRCLRHPTRTPAGAPDFSVARKLIFPWLEITFLQSERV